MTRYGTVHTTCDKDDKVSLPYKYNTTEKSIKHIQFECLPNSYDDVCLTNCLSTSAPGRGRPNSCAAAGSVPAVPAQACASRPCVQCMYVYMLLFWFWVWVLTLVCYTSIEAPTTTSGRTAEYRNFSSSSVRSCHIV